MTAPQNSVLRYQNPIYPHSAPDPFVLKYCGEYWGCFSGLQPDGRAFGLLHSPDLIHWRYLGSALDPRPSGDPHYWAPEMTYHEGVFYFYYSVGDEAHMHLRVATASHPAGPFTDSGLQLTAEKFAIDPHIFVDGDGTRYLFYATDFLEHNRIGTGTVMDRLLDPFTLEGRPRPVSRARYDWQIFDPHRAEKGGVCWHTLEGSFVLKHGGLYYQMFSGGNWKNKTYGIGYAVTERLDTGEEWEQVCDGENSLPVLHSMPELGVIGPGHNSVVRGPDNRQLYCVYHRWQTETAERVLAVDPLDWEGDRLVVHGPSVTPQSMAAPAVSGFAQVACERGACRQERDTLSLEPQSGEEAAEASMALPAPGFVLEVSLRLVELRYGCQWGLSLAGEMGEIYRFALQTGGSQGAESSLSIHTGAAARPVERFPLAGFQAQAYHLLRLEVQAGQLRLSLDGDLLQDGARLHWSGAVRAAPQAVRFFASRAAAAFAGLAISI